MNPPDDTRELRLRRDDVCAECGVSQSRGTAAYWSDSARNVYCLPCVGGAELARSIAGTAGSAAAREHARRQAKDAARIRARWGSLTPIAERFVMPKQSTRAWARGAAGEERLAAFLERELGDAVILLHDRSIPGSRANIDHIAVGPSGVWAIDAKRYTGTVRRRDVGGLFRTDVRVFVGGRDQTKLVKKLEPQLTAVRTALVSVPAFSAIDVNGALCFTDSDWGFMNLGKPFAIDGVVVTYPGALRATLREPIRLSSDEAGRVAAHLALALPPA
jgi:hypothetical protein